MLIIPVTGPFSISSIRRIDRHPNQSGSEIFPDTLQENITLEYLTGIYYTATDNSYGIAPSTYLISSWQNLTYLGNGTILSNNYAVANSTYSRFTAINSVYYSYHISAENNIPFNRSLLFPYYYMSGGWDHAYPDSQANSRNVSLLWFSLLIQEKSTLNLSDSGSIWLQLSDTIGLDTKKMFSEYTFEVRCG